MAPHSSTLAWKIPGAAEPGRLQSMGSRRVGHDLATSLSLFTCMRWRRKWQPTPVFLPGESQGRGSLVGCRPWGHTESDMTEVTQQQQQQSTGSVAVTHRLNSSTVCGIFQSQGSSTCPLQWQCPFHWQADSLPLNHQGCPVHLFLVKALLR